MSATTALAPAATKALAVASAQLNDAVHDHLVPMAARHGSVTKPLARYVHYCNATARALGLPKSDASVIAALPIEEHALLALIRRGVAARIPQWASTEEAAGGTKPHNRILARAKAWADLEAKALRACGAADVIARAEKEIAA